ncbi:MAG: hypothetical protein QMD09_09900 [Desulfatibacillaceae bacterium]|nr:hypothetical protein [Desulfatibacillaceae bacterium]
MVRLNGKQTRHPKGVYLNDPDVLEIRGGGGCLLVVGLFFAAFGGLFAFTMLNLPQGHSAGQILGAAFGGLFALLGAAMLLGRWGMKLYRREGRLFSWWGMGLLLPGLTLPLKTKSVNLSDFSFVRLSKEVRKSSGSKSNSQTVYPVSLDGDKGQEKLKEFSDYASARGLAELVAKFLGLDLHDSSSGETLLRQAAFLDESLRQKALRTGEAVSAKQRPINMRSTVTPGAGTVDIVVPASGITLFHGAGLAFITSISAISYYFEGWFPSVFIILFPGLAILGHASQGIRIRADRQGLWLKKTWLGLGITRHIPTNEIEELVAARILPEGMELSELPEKHRAVVLAAVNFFVRPKLVARSDRQTLEVSGAVSGEEMEYLLSLVKRELVR